FYFFFSSRRRHTRFSRDWSSDVCSSDLAEGGADVDPAALCAGKKVVVFSLPGAFTPTCSQQHLPGYVAKLADLQAQGVDLVACRSEERRVGKEGRWGWAPGR